MKVIIADATSTGRETAREILSGIALPITLRELVRLRVREEVARFNANLPAGPLSLLVEPGPEEQRLNPERPGRQLDWVKQASIAERAFAANGFLVFVGKTQIEDLDVQLPVDEVEVVSFVRLVALVGG